MRSNLLNLMLLPFCCLLLVATSVAQQTEKKDDKVSDNPNAVVDTAKRSIKSTVSATIGDAAIRINYHSPGVRGRTIWGKVVPYDKVWVTGAHDATSIEVDKDFLIEDKEIPAGKYALFTIPGQDTWTVIINKNWKQHQADKYDAKEDVARFQVRPRTNKKTTERLQYFIEKVRKNHATVRMAWEKVQIQFKVAIKK